MYIVTLEAINDTVKRISETRLPALEAAGQNSQSIPNARGLQDLWVVISNIIAAMKELSEHPHSSSRWEQLRAVIREQQGACLLNLTTHIQQTEDTPSYTSGHISDNDTGANVEEVVGKGVSEEGGDSTSLYSEGDSDPNDSVKEDAPNATYEEDVATHPEPTLEDEDIMAPHATDQEAAVAQVEQGFEDEEIAVPHAGYGIVKGTQVEEGSEDGEDIPMEIDGGDAL